MSINQTQLYDTLQSLIQQTDIKAEFIYGFLDAYGFAKSTITQLRNGGARNVAKIAGDVALKGQLYFHPVQAGENLHEIAERLRDGDAIKTHKIRFVVVTNFEELVAYDLKADERIDTPFTELHQQYSFFLPLAGLEKSYIHSESVADVKAAEKMGRLFDLVRERNQVNTVEEVHALNVFLTRLLFCFFAEDTGIFDKHQFTDAIKSTTREDGEDVAEFLGKLFSVLNDPDDGALRQSMPTHLNSFPYVNGGLFAQKLSTPAFGAKSRRLLLECGTLDWSQINPDIFGSMFQAVIDEEQRSTMGQHYTSVSNIMKVIKPLFLDKLYCELDRSLGNEKKLQALLERVARIKVFDPACGSGNFLIIAYKELRRFEMEVFRALNAVSKQRVMFMTGIQLSQFYGIEIDDFAHEIALLSLWLAEHQMNTEFKAAFGRVEPTLPLKASGNVIHANSLQINWQEVCPPRNSDSTEPEIYICGNPPFLGKGDRSVAQTEDMQYVLGELKNFKNLDFVACWFYIAAKYIHETGIECAFVSTNSITQGEQVGVLWPAIFAKGISINFAYQTFVWKNGARSNAGVHVVIIGISAAPKNPRIFVELEGGLRSLDAKNINPYLLDSSCGSVLSRRSSLCKVSAIMDGNNYSKCGGLILTTEEKAELLASEPNASKWIRKFVGADEFLNSKDRWCIWLPKAMPNEIDAMPFIRKRIDSVRTERLLSEKKETREKAALTPHLFPEIRQPISGQYLLIPRVTSERRLYAPIGYMDSSVITSNQVLMVPKAGLFEFGVLSSAIHMDWMRVVGGRLKSDYRYSASLVYNTFPWPDATDSQRKRIEMLAEEVLMTRENYPDKSLAELYDPDIMPNDLKASHNVLDEAVERLYRSRPFRDASERLEHLFARYEMLIEQEQQQLGALAAAYKPRSPRASKTGAAE
ncbi:class I SAM-dependent DNA methyltransferase [Pseudomonas paracarnis]|uniref:class I SAM-dependent DNA methyltransferase n=1 Tax=Pseudomonas paracarnis TaxID=2750625 RepID=UPI002FE313F7